MLIGRPPSYEWPHTQAPAPLNIAGNYPGSYLGNYEPALLNSSLLTQLVWAATEAMEKLAILDHQVCSKYPKKVSTI